MNSTILVQQITEAQQIVKAKFELRRNEFTVYNADNLFLKEDDPDDMGFLPKELIALQLESFTVKEFAFLHILFDKMSSREQFDVDFNQPVVDIETLKVLYQIKIDGKLDFEVRWFLGLEHILELYQEGLGSFDLDFRSFYN